VKATAITWRIEEGAKRFVVTFGLLDRAVIVEWDGKIEQFQGNQATWKPKSESFAKEAIAHALSVYGARLAAPTQHQRQHRPDAHERQLPVGDR
jgi:hypothetical protein